MMKIRIIEERIAEEYLKQEMRCPMHLCIGQESVSVAVSQNLKTSDSVYSGHRAHGHYIAKGGSINKFIAELYGKESGCVGGIGGSMHLLDKKVNFMASTPIVGGIVPIAAGHAWFNKLSNNGNLTVIYIGDGCFEEGVIHETMNFAALHALPLVFICENNNFSVYTQLKDRQPENRKIYKIAEAHGITSFNFNGQNVEDLSTNISKIFKNQRLKGKPSFIEIDVYRWREHCGPNFDNELNYRSKKDIENGEEQCPIKFYKNKLINEKIIDEKKYESFVKKFNRDFEKALEFSFNSPIPKIKNHKNLYAN